MQWAVADFRAGLLYDDIRDRFDEDFTDVLNLALITVFPECHPDTGHDRADFTATIESVIEDRADELLDEWKRTGSFYGAARCTAERKDQLIAERKAA